MKPSPGDLIEIFRVGYQHWGVYVGDWFIVHLVNLGPISPSSPSTSSTSSSSQAVKVKGKVKRQRLQDVADGARWRVNNKWDKICKPHPAKKIVKEALSLVGEDMEYHPADLNCEHFARKLRYGVSLSWQVLKYALAGCAGLVGGAAGTIIGPEGTVLGAVGAAYFTKVFLDILD